MKHGKWKKSFTKHHTHLRFCLYEMVRIEKSIEIESRLVVSQGCEVWGKWGTTVKGCRISFWGEKSVSKSGCAHGCTTLNKYTENHWNGWSVWHMNYISISWFCKSNFRMYRITRLRSRLRYRNGLRQLSFYKHESVTHCCVANHLETYQLRTTTIFILVINLQSSVGTNCLCPIWHHLGPLDWGPPMAQLASWYWRQLGVQMVPMDWASLHFYFVWLISKNEYGKRTKEKIHCLSCLSLKSHMVSLAHSHSLKWGRGNYRTHLLTGKCPIHIRTKKVRR